VLPLITPPKVRLLALLLSNVAATLEPMMILFPTLKPAAPDCNVLLAVTLKSPAPSALLLPTCNVPALKVVPTVPVAGP
jgi:hypothetical protein